MNILHTKCICLNHVGWNSSCCYSNGEVLQMDSQHYINPFALNSSKFPSLHFADIKRVCWQPNTFSTCSAAISLLLRPLSATTHLQNVFALHRVSNTFRTCSTFTASPIPSERVCPSPHPQQVRNVFPLEPQWQRRCGRRARTTSRTRH
jgi:hypothetical protein